MKRNLTIQLDEPIINKARLVAARRSISISRLVSEQIVKLSEKESYWRVAKRAALARLDKPFHLGGRIPDRETLHER